MGIRRFVTIVAAVVAAVVGGVAPTSAHEGHEHEPARPPLPDAYAPTNQYNLEARYRWQNPRTICVQSSLGSGWTSQKAAVADLDSIAEFRVVYKEGTNACRNAGWAKRIILTKVNEPGKASRAWVDWQASAPMVWGKSGDGRWSWMLRSPVYIRMNTAVTGRTWSQNVATWRHELAHAVVGPLGDEWDGGGHSSRCDSVLSSRLSCVQSHDGFTTRDRAMLSRVYADWS